VQLLDCCHSFVFLASSGEKKRVARRCEGVTVTGHDLCGGICCVGGYASSRTLSVLSVLLHPAPNAGENAASGWLIISS